MKSGLSSTAGLTVVCPACGKRQRVARRGTRKLQCGHCRERIDLPSETPGAVASEADLPDVPEAMQALVKLAARVEALEAEVARLRADALPASLALAQGVEKAPPLNFAARLANCRPGKLSVLFAGDQAGASDHAARLCQLFSLQQWEVTGPASSQPVRAGTTFAVGTLPMTPAHADLFMALRASGVEVVSVLDQNLLSDEACLTITNETALLVPGEETRNGSIRAA